jgi:D-alanyl-D-alanine carboxypeptidase/D-alanyl-D-alanine-endopeptidase (penicillin-binding protein 4)
MRAVALLLLLSQAPPVLAQSWPAVVRAELDASGIPGEAIGLYVQEIGAQAPLLDWNADAPMNPASAMKLLTTLAALDLLGPAYTWRTEVYTYAPLRGDVLEGDLVLRGGGDPKLDLEKFWLLLKVLRGRGLREIRGDLVADRSAFALDDADPARFDNAPTRPYNVQPDALLVNYKSIDLQFVPEEDTGTVRIVSLPDLAPIGIVNQLALGAGSCDFWPERPMTSLQAPQLVFTGVFPRGCGEKRRSFSLLTPDHYLETLFRQLWQEAGGTFTGRVREGRVSASPRLFATWESPPLAEVIRDVNKWSNNVMARQLFLTLGLQRDGPPATTLKATHAVQEWLGRIGLEIPELVLENGSGLSRSERISARNLARLLEHGWNSPLLPEYLASLPIPGVDGTLRRRLNGSPAAGQAHLKSGYIDGVRSVAGYVRDRRGRWLLLVCIVNHPQAVAAQPFLDALVDWAWTGGGEDCCKR